MHKFNLTVPFKRKISYEETGSIEADIDANSLEEAVEKLKIILEDGFHTSSSGAGYVEICTMENLSPVAHCEEPDIFWERAAIA